MIRSFLSSVLVFLGLAVVQTLVFSNIEVLPAVPDLLLLALLYLSVRNGPLFGETTGFMSGLLFDFLSMQPFGLNCLLRTIIGFLCGLLRRTLNTGGILIPCVLGACITVVKALLLFVIAFLFPRGNIPVYHFFDNLTFVVELACNIVAAPIVFRLLAVFKPFLLLPEEVADV
ncbi:MAG: hypothetical protein Ta2A_26810 [Treponemataceae bacterium]|nr:MAG: hypothetical protein Ta2A_26810 [Treponemataceae bacterium]